MNLLDELQRRLEALTPAEREAVNAVAEAVAATVRGDTLSAVAFRLDELRDRYRAFLEYTGTGRSLAIDLETLASLARHGRSA